MNGGSVDQPIAGILLAAGRGSRFDGSGKQNKLLQVLPNGDTVAATTARNLRTALAVVLAVVPRGAPELADELRGSGCIVTEMPGASEAMSASIVHALSKTHNAAGWIIALADMPLVRHQTIVKLVQALEQGADIVVPVCGGKRGNPVGFGKYHLGMLQNLTGDAGARALLRSHPVVEIPVDDPGIHQDIDHRDDYEITCRILRHYNSSL